ncbi:hypothetical protein WJX72_007145 [[Myrmecia] bisecta]|uniref:Uncharacterized protein n=1 Tax=[Myrmecia] bisecta TaxID=41462 RepID=A0AAW1PB21_9CHLO
MPPQGKRRKQERHNAGEDSRAGPASAPCRISALGVLGSLTATASHAIVVVNLLEAEAMFGAPDAAVWPVSHQLGEDVLGLGILAEPTALGVCTIQGPLTPSKRRPEPFPESHLIPCVTRALKRLRAQLPSPPISATVHMVVHGVIGKEGKHTSLAMGPSEAVRTHEWVGQLLACLRSELPAAKAWVDIQACWTSQCQMDEAFVGPISQQLRGREAVTVPEYGDVRGLSTLLLDRPVALACFFRQPQTTVVQALGGIRGDACRKVLLTCIEPNMKISRFAFGGRLLGQTRDFDEEPDGTVLDLSQPMRTTFDVLRSSHWASQCAEPALVGPPDLTYCACLLCHCVSKAGLTKALLAAFPLRLKQKSASWMREQIGKAVQASDIRSYRARNAYAHLAAPIVFMERDAERIGQYIAAMLRPALV